MSEAFDKVTHALESHGCNRHGNDWTCPHHKGGGEKRPSLSVNEGSKGVVMTCGAGCSNEEVLRSVGLKLADMFDAPAITNGKEKRKIIATYDYTDEQGKLLYQVLRTDPKGFMQRKPKDNGGWEWTIKDVRKVLYHLPQLIESAGDNKSVHIVEGEKDVEAIERAGGIATCNSGGAGKWLDEFATFFAGRNVIIVRDKDDAGNKHVNQVITSLQKNGLGSYEIVEAKIGKDAAEHLGGGFGLDEFIPVLDLTTDDAPTDKINSLDARLMSIDEIMNIPPPTYIIDELVVSDALTVLWGAPGSAKSFVALDWAFCVAHGQPTWHGKVVMEGPVLYIVAEGLSGVSMRMKAWRVENPVHTIGELTWLRDPVNLLDQQAVDELIEVCDRIQPILVIVDTLARSMPGADENAPGPMSSAIEALDSIRRVTRAGIVAIHHSPKDGSSPRGHSSLVGAVQTSIKQSMTDGVVKLEVEKQKDGNPISMELRLAAVDQSAVLRRNDDAHRASNEMWSEAMIIKALREHSLADGLSNSDIMELTKMPKATYFRARKALSDAGRIVPLGRQRWALPLGSGAQTE